MCIMCACLIYIRIYVCSRNLIFILLTYTCQKTITNTFLCIFRRTHINLRKQVSKNILYNIYILAVLILHFKHKMHIECLYNTQFSYHTHLHYSLSCISFIRTSIRLASTPLVKEHITKRNEEA